MYCMFNRSGEIVPLQFRVEDENQELQTFKVKRYKAPKTEKNLNRGYHTAFYATSILKYDVVVEVFGKEKIMQVCYNIQAHKWGVVV